MSNTQRSRTRLWIEAAASALVALAGLLALVKPGWIEMISGADPDRGSGLLEAVIAISLAVAVIASTTLARLEWSRAKAVGAGGN